MDLGQPTGALDKSAKLEQEDSEHLTIIHYHEQVASDTLIFEDIPVQIFCS